MIAITLQVIDTIFCFLLVFKNDMKIHSQNFPQLLKSWRKQVGISQLELAMRSGVSQKHISFLEKSRARPSQMMVMQICEALNIPLRVRNHFLISAGFAPAYKESALSAPELSAVNRAVDMILANQSPYPAFVLDRYYNIIRANDGALSLQCLLYEVTRPQDLPQIAGNLIQGFFHPQGIGSYVKNHDLVATYLLQQLQNEIIQLMQGEEKERFLKTIFGEEMSEQFETLSAAYSAAPSSHEQTAQHPESPLISIEIEKGKHQLSFFSTITTLGTPQDITLQEIRIESYFPGDDETKAFFQK